MTAGETKILLWLREHAGHWLFVGTSIGGAYVGCNECCSVTTPRDWPSRTHPPTDPPDAHRRSEQ